MKFFENIDFEGIKAEFIGVFAIVYVGGWSWMNYTFKYCEIGEVGLTHLIVYTLFVWTGKGYSGALYNPFLTLVRFLFKKINLPTTVFYLIFQCLASILAASVLKLIAPDAKSDIIRNNKFIGFIDMFKDHGLGTWIVIIVYEAIGACIITIVYYLIIFDRRNKKGLCVEGLAIGAAYGSMTIGFGQLTGAGCNPIKVLGPGLVGKSYWPMLPYLAGQAGGTLAGAFLCELILMKGKRDGEDEDDENIENKRESLKDEESISELPELKDDDEEAPRESKETALSNGSGSDDEDLDL